MNTTTFKDIFKSSFLEQTTSFSLVDSLIGLLVAFAVGLFIYVIYKKTYSGVIYSHTFNIALIVISMATALIIMGISSNVLLSLGMVGALSIVRFRTPIKDPMDLVYLFWSIVVGILCGAGFIPLVILGSALIGLVLVLFVNRITVENPYLIVIKYDHMEVEKTLEKLVGNLSKKHTLKSKSAVGQSYYENTYEVRLKKEEQNIINLIADVDGVTSAVMLSYDGNFTA
ncbi:DUF4956 domain-containing protein [Psychrobacillus glaciei]|uniref:DUF4956 domain-containing protein n=1 Tax=Psychrobacillus glaciei TaxID=2283160 RepID=A0A5J6ST09_9BACI|nr:DUF4956 domain-containing protein [Psychrobacillus glaciei]QFG00654.1 DUF4956 domain-containing protein [Psychrobacillus glaciei]